MEATEWKLAVCGLNCAKCGLFKATKCGGCRGSLENHWSPGCKMRACALDLGHEYCFECSSFPCATIQSFANDGQTHHRTTVKNLVTMKTIGLQAWIEKQPAVSFCPVPSE